ncbi:AP-1 adaptor complex gamma subunit Apl4 [Schizosaccharomyces osmophilus]|uniref:AP-1 complex subunit gamma n=1 Tax=Schizosaccharomyces osmophilus TaxID=2545709 RepID=A0AAE9WIB9_9SCHI|nr:AP-1 adaptor complex gamma subunit Apl4 [Schizosaccharomyces osmophilus]WBW75342.1 AP-1 adaptor complex gamma subunit Apl4 [Schizosaccharomyces osmophilus]
MSSLKTFIKAVRASKTTAEENSAIRKESAQIRKNIRQGSADTRMRRRNVAKLLYLYLLGEPTHFGQIECLKLLSSAQFMDKRLGYLGAMLLLDENQEVLTLLTNSLQQDLQSPNKFIVSLALSAFGNIASPELARDLSNIISKLCASSHNYVSKKALLCALRVVQKEPELAELYLLDAEKLLHSKSHGVLMSDISLVMGLCRIHPDLIPRFAEHTDGLIHRLRQLSSNTYSSELNIGNVSDPFLQIKILQILSVFAQHDASVNDRISDILAQVCSNTDSSRNAGNAILYQAVRTILDVDSDSSLRVLGVNILAKFLGNRDNNTRYVALNMLKRVVNTEENAVQRHRSTILSCLYDVDISIQARALELSTFLVNETNVRFMVRELLTYLDTVSDDMRSRTAQYITEVTNAFAPNKRWHFDTLLRVFKSAGNFLSETALSTFLRLIASAPDLHEYAIFKLYAALKDDISQEALIMASLWVIGEYGQYLLSPSMNFDDDTLPKSISEDDILDLVEEVLIGTNFTQATVIQYGLNTLIKLSTRFQSSSSLSKIQRLIEFYGKHRNTEVQQRSVEYQHVIEDPSLDRTVMQSIPAPSPPARITPYQNAEQKLNASKKPVKETEETNDLLDLIGLGGASQAETLINETPSANTTAAYDLANITSVPKKSQVDDILGLFSTPAPAAEPAANTLANSFASLDMSGSNHSQTASTPPQSKQYEPLLVYDKHDVTLSLYPSRDEATKTAIIEARFKNKSIVSRVEKVHLEIAVPKSQKLRLQPLRSTSMDPGMETSQTMRIQGPKDTQVKLRLRISVTREGEAGILDQIDYGKLPSDLLS